MSEPTAPDRADEALRAMLEARADRLPARAATDVMAAVHEEVQAPRGGAAFALLPVMAGRSSMPGAGWAVAALVAVLALAVLGGLPRRSSTPASTGPAPTGSPSASWGTPPPGGGVRAIVSLAQLRQALSDGSLDGRLVIVDSTLRQAPTLCPNGGCAPTFGLDLVGPVVTDIRSTQPVVPAQPGSSSDSMAGTWVVVPHAGALILVGWMVEPADQPQTWSTLMFRMGRLLFDANVSLDSVAGWLVTGAGGTHVITETQPRADGSPVDDRHAEFGLGDPALGIDPSAAVTAGPFLVRLGPGSQPEIVARYNPGSLVTVVMPSITCAEPPPNATLGCEDAVAAASAVDQVSSPITSVEFVYGSDGANGQVVLHHELVGQDLWVTVRAGPGGGVVIVDRGTFPPLVGPTASPAETPMTPAGLRAALAAGTLADHIVLIDGVLQRLPMPCPSPAGPDCWALAVKHLDGVQVQGETPIDTWTAGLAPASGLLVFRGERGWLTYLGYVTGQVDASITVARLLAGGSAPAAGTLSVVSGWLVVGGIHSCPALGPGATPCPGPAPWLTDDQPFPEGMLASNQGTHVSLDGSPIGRPAGQILTPGPFLVRQAWSPAICDAPSGVDCSGLQRTVVAILDPAITVRVSMP